MIFVVVVIIATALWQVIIESGNGQIEENTEIGFVTPDGEVQIDFPNTWEVKDSQFGEGFYTLDLDGPRNASIARLLREQEDIDITTGVTTVQLAEIINRSIANDYVSLSVDVVSANGFELSESLDSRKQELLDGLDATSGVSFGEFVDLEINDNPAFRYESRLIDGGAVVDSINYFVLGETAEVDVVIFPSSSNYAAEAEAIIKNMVIRTNDQLDALHQQVQEAVKQVQEQEQ